MAIHIKLGLASDTDGQSLIETALSIPIMILLMAYAIDLGYMFLAAATISSVARNAAQYSVNGYQGPAQSALPPAGPDSSMVSVSELAIADLASLANAQTIATVQVCSKSLGMNGNIPVCASYGPAAGTYTPIADPEAPTFVLQRVDVTYTIQPPIPLSVFKVSLLPNLQFHRQVSMRVMD